MKILLKTLWRDPVWSAVIAAIILAVAAYFLQWWPIIVRFIFVEIPLIYYIATVGAAALAIYLLMEWLRRRPFGRRAPDGPHDFELQPISFMIDLVQDVPYVEVRYYAVNYHNHPITLIEVNTAELRVSSGSPIVQIPLSQEYSLAPSKSIMVFCRRTLKDSEARAVSQEKKQCAFTGSFSLIAKARAGRHEYTYGPVAAKWIEGWVNNRRE